MKKKLTYILLLIFGLFYAQKMAYVDTQYILKQMPEYQKSEGRLDEQIKKWQKSIIDNQSKLERMKLSFENEKVLLTDEQQKTKLSTIDSIESNLNQFIEKKFGAQGESTTLRYNLAKPLQDQIWNAINTIATKEKYNFIFDKSSDLIMVYTDSRYDITDKVLKQLGVNNKKEGEDSEEEPAKKPKKTTNKSKSGYGSRYTPKKDKKKTEDKEVVSESLDSKEEVNEGEKEVIEPKKNKKETKEKAEKSESGYGSRYTPKKKEKEENTRLEERQDEEKAKPKKEKVEKPKTDNKPKTGYGSKYVPKKTKQKIINNSIQ